MKIQTDSTLRQTVQDAIDYFSFTEKDLKYDELYYITALVDYIIQLETAILDHQKNSTT